MKILVVGSGGREHAILWRLAQGGSAHKLYAAPGNPGIARIAECHKADTNSPAQLLALAASLGVDLTVVGPEAPLVAGAVDAFRAAGRAIVGPTQAAAQLEGSKIFSKRFLERAGIPTAGYVAVDNEADALRHLDRFGFPVVLKADGLAAGKGVLIAEDRTQAETAVRGLLSGELVGSAGSRLVIEEFLRGEEVSFIVLTDGKHVVPLEPTQDHKAVHDGDTGPNTGGMGAYCDARILDAAARRQIIERVIEPTVAQTSADGMPFTGFLYAGLMMTEAGPKVLEFNVRLGDPETQALMHRMDSDFASVLLAAARGDLSGASLRWHAEPSVCVVLASAGYPGTPGTGFPITGIDEAEALGATVFHAGTRLGQNDIENAGGRVLGITASGADLAGAIQNAYEAVRPIRFEGMHYRTDIGKKGLKRWAMA
ncbi:MAG: phosphoribosylamine--glycine ligase [Bryobacteraceae bacterium]